MLVMRASAARAISELRVLTQNAVSELESAMGGPLTQRGAAMLRAWLAKAFEAGEQYGRSAYSEDEGRA
jgi:hypothetical protein